MATTKIVSQFDGGKTITNYVPANMTNALAFADAILKTKTEAHEQIGSVEGTSPAVGTAVYEWEIAAKSADNKLVYISFIGKPNVDETQIKAALVGKTFVKNGQDILIERCSVSKMKAVVLA